MKRLIVRSTGSIVTLATVISLLSLAVSSTKAQEVQTCTQVTQYGGAVGIVCGAHTPVETGLADINPLVLASIFFMFSGYGLYEYKKLQKVQLRI